MAKVQANQLLLSEGKTRVAIGESQSCTLVNKKQTQTLNKQKLWSHFSRPPYRLRLDLSEGRSEVSAQRRHEAGGILQVGLARAEKAPSVFLGHEVSLDTQRRERTNKNEGGWCQGEENTAVVRPTAWADIGRKSPAVADRDWLSRGR